MRLSILRRGVGGAWYCLDIGDVAGTSYRRGDAYKKRFNIVSFCESLEVMSYVVKRRYRARMLKQRPIVSLRGLCFARAPLPWNHGLSCCNDKNVQFEQLHDTHNVSEGWKACCRGTAAQGPSFKFILKRIISIESVRNPTRSQARSSSSSPSNEGAGGPPTQPSRPLAFCSSLSAP